MGAPSVNSTSRVIVVARKYGSIATGGSARSRFRLDRYSHEQRV
jgi:hypothetical protein